MTHETAILKDLSAGQTTADSLAPRIRLSPTATETVLRRLISTGEVETSSVSIGGNHAFTVYLLTAGCPKTRPLANEHFTS